MSVTEIASAMGEWNVKLREDTPLYILDALGYFGHIAITPSRVDPEEYGDSLMDSARYVGVLRGRGFGEGNKTISGPGMAFWLGDEDDKGDTIEDTPIVFTNSTFTNAITTLLPSSIHPGSIAALAGLYNGSHSYQSRRKALDYVTGLYNAEWRVRGSGLLDAGAISDLYVTQPKVAILRNRSGLEMDYRALRGRASLDSDVKDFTTRLLLLGTADDQSTVVSASANIAGGLNPYVDLFGNPLRLTRLVSETATNDTNAPARAQLQLNRFTSPKDTLKLSTTYYDIRGDVQCGDWVWVWDPDAKIEDQNNQIDFEGDILYPLKLRVFQLSWPITSAMGVAFRTNAGVWYDLTDYVVPETGDTSVTVGGYNRSLTGVGSGPGDNIGSAGITPNTDVPDEPTWNQPFSQSTYQGTDGLTRAQVVLDWNQPLNTDSTVITDGGYYEIRWRTGATGVYALTHQDLAVYSHNFLTGTWASPIPYVQGEWQSTQVSWDTRQLLLGDLTPGVPYEFQVRGVDSATPANAGDWTSPVITVQTRPDTNAPTTPAAAQTVAGSRNAIQVVHTLGKASGGTFNLELDLNHLKIHAGLAPEFQPVNDTIANGGTLLGKVLANQGMLRGQIPVVATFGLDNDPATPRWIKVVAVDNFGNESGPSAPIQQTATLYDSAFISELTVSKVSAGTILANWIMAAEIATAMTGARVRIGWFGIEAYNVNNIRTFYVNSATGGLTMIGKLIASDPIAAPGDAITIWPSLYDSQSYPAITFESSGAAYPGPAYINAIPGFGGNGTALGLNSGPSAAASPQNQSTLILGGQAWFLQYNSLSPTANIVTGGQVYGDVTTAQLAAWDAGTQKAYIQTSVAGQAWMRSVVGACEIDCKANGEILLISSVAQIWMESDGDIRLTPASGKEITAGRPFGSKGAGFSFESQDGGTYPAQGIRTYASGGTLRFVDNATGSLVGDGASGTKSFVIPHPTEKDRWLVHGCTESPYSGVEYWGEAEIQDHVCIVPLPDYFEDLTLEAGRVVLVTIQLPDEPMKQTIEAPEFPANAVTLLHRQRMPAQVIKEAGLIPTTVGASRPKDGQFRITSNGPDGTRVAWLVKARRKDVEQFEVEPLRDDYELRGAGPYKFLRKAT